MFDEKFSFKCLAIGVPRAATVVDTYESRCQKSGVAFFVSARSKASIKSNSVVIKFQIDPGF